MFKRSRSMFNVVCFKCDNNCLRMRRKCIDFTAGRKFVTGNGFGDSNLLYVGEIFAARCCFSPILAMFHCKWGFWPRFYFQLKIWRYMWIQCTRFPIKTKTLPARGIVFGVFCDGNVRAYTVTELVLLPVANLSPEMDWATPVSYMTQTFRLCTSV